MDMDMNQNTSSDYAEPPKAYLYPNRGMAFVKATGILCLTSIIGVAMVLFYIHSTDRFSVIPSEGGGIYVLDRKESYLNHCDGGAHCQTIVLGRTPAETAARVCETMAQQGQVMSGMVGGFVMPQFQGTPMASPQMMMQGASSPVAMGMQPSAVGMGAPGMAPQDAGFPGQTSLTPSMILGAGIPRAAPPSVIQGTMQSGQNMVNAGVMMPPRPPVMPAPAAAPIAAPSPVAQPVFAPRPAPVVAPAPAAAGPVGPLRPVGTVDLAAIRGAAGS